MACNFITIGLLRRCPAITQRSVRWLSTRACFSPKKERLQTILSIQVNMYICSKKLLPINEPQMLAFFKKNFNFTYTLLWFHQNSIVKKLMDPLYQLQFYWISSTLDMSFKQQYQAAGILARLQGLGQPILPIAGPLVKKIRGKLLCFAP